MKTRLRSVSTDTPRSDDGERVLVGRARAGDRDAQQALLMECLPRARRTITRLVGPTDEVDDLLQTTCLEALRSLRKFKGDASFASWMDRIAAHVVYKHFRTSSRRRKRLREAALVEVDEAGRNPNPATHVERRRAMAQLRELLGELPADRRMIFLLVSVDGRTVEDAAIVLGISLSAAKSRYLRARRQVDRLMQGRPELLAALKGEGSHEGSGHG